MSLEGNMNLFVTLGATLMFASPLLCFDSCFIFSLRLQTVPGLESVPLQFAPQLDHLSPGGVQSHKPLSRTRSEPLPQSPHTLHTQLLHQQHSAQILERLKQQTHLGKVLLHIMSYY